MTPEGVDRAAGILAAARRVVVSTGAGMSRESGIPTFRDAMEGLWAQFDPQALATEAGFRAHPRRVWSWYAGRRRKAADILRRRWRRRSTGSNRNDPDAASISSCRLAFQ